MKSSDELAKRGVIKLKDILNLINHEGIGIPHFQRGLVWPDEMKGQLLLSLLLQTPINSILFWKPLFYKNEARDGLGGNNSNISKLCIVDGQQRLTTIKEIFIDDLKWKNEECFDYNWHMNTLREENWCINLSQIEYDNEGIQFNCIGKPVIRKMICEKAEEQIKTQTHNNYMPLKYLVKYELGYDKSFWDPFFKSKQYDHEQMILHLKRMFLKVFDEEINYSLLIENNIKYSFTRNKVVDAYIRINSAGKRVEEEEKTYATLSGISGIDLSEIFNKIHSNNTRKYGELQRARENNFGLKTFIRVFTQLLYYHNGFNLAKEKDFSFAEARKIITTLTTCNQTHLLIQIWEETKNILLYLAEDKVGLLRNELQFDDFRFLPERAMVNLRLIIQLWILYPNLITSPKAKENSDLRKLNIELTLRILIKNEFDPKSLEQLNSKFSVLEAIKFIRKITNIDKEGLKRELNKIKTVQNYYVNLFYVLLRNNRARDLSINNIDEDKKDSFEKEYAEKYSKTDGYYICKSLNSTKQHIIPAAKFRNSRKGFANNIGNLTFMSEMLNTLNGIKDKPIKIEYETKENAYAHFLSDKHFDNNMYKSLLGKKELLDDEDKNYEYLYQKRNESIADAFLNWVKYSTINADVNIPEAPRTKRVFNFGIENLIYDMNLNVQRTENYKETKYSVSLKEDESFPYKLYLAESKDKSGDYVKLILEYQYPDEKININEEYFDRIKNIQENNSYKFTLPQLNSINRQKSKNREINIKWDKNIGGEKITNEFKKLWKESRLIDQIFLKNNGADSKR